MTIVLRDLSRLHSNPHRVVSMSFASSLTVVYLALFTLSGPPALAQQTTGVPGSPSSTTTVDGRYCQILQRSSAVRST